MEYILTVIAKDKSRQVTAFANELLARRAANRALGNGAFSADVAPRS